jgi:hypothetical protein
MHGPARVTGLGQGLSGGLARWRAVHDPGKIIADLVVTLALGGDCLADIAVLRERPGLAGPVASGPVVSRLLSARRIRSFRLVRAMDAPGPGFLSVHKLAGPEVLEEPGCQAAISTPWRDRVVAPALRRERRAFGLRNAIGA